MGHPRPLFRLFFVFFKQTLQILQKINEKKCIRRRDLNSRSSDYESPPLTTKPGLNGRALEFINWNSEVRIL